MAKKNQSRSKQSKAKKMGDLPTGRKSRNVKGGSLNFTSGAPARGLEGTITIPLRLEELAG